MLGDETLLSRLATNVVDNAIRHNHIGDFLIVTVKADGSAARMTVENSGPLLPDDKVAELAQPFRRLVADRTGSDDGVGLGLSIVAEITTAFTTAHSSFRPRSKGGLRVTVTLPRAANGTENG